MGSSAGGVFLPGDPPPSTSQTLTTPIITTPAITGGTVSGTALTGGTVSGAAITGGTVSGVTVTSSGATLTAPVINGAATVASGAVFTTPTATWTTTGVIATGATGNSGAVLPTVTPCFVTVTGATNSGVDLPTGPAGAAYLIKNAFAGTMRFYCVGGTINGNSGATAALITTTGNQTAWFVCTTATGAWFMVGNT